MTFCIRWQETRNSISDLPNLVFTCIYKITYRLETTHSLLSSHRSIPTSIRQSVLFAPFHRQYTRGINRRWDKHSCHPEVLYNWVSAVGKDYSFHPSDYIDTAHNHLEQERR